MEDSSDTGETPPALDISIREHDEGMFVMRVYADSPAAEEGLQEGNIITAVNGDAVDFAWATGYSPTNRVTA